MRGFLIDTNVLSDLRRPQPNAGVVALIDHQPDELIFTSEVNFAEIRYGRDLIRDQVKQSAIDVWLERELRPWFGLNLLPFNEDALVVWRHIVESGRTRRFTFPEPDTMIAAVAKHNELIVVPRDITPFSQAGVPVLDPWQARFVASSGIEHSNIPLAEPALVHHLSAL